MSNINLSFGQKVIFQDAKLSINQGDRIGLIGLNGHGKSTLFNIISGKVNPDISTPPFIFDKNKEKFIFFYIPQELELKSFEDLDVTNFWLSFYPELLNINRELRKIENLLIEDYENESLLNKQAELLDSFEQLDGWNIENSYLSYLNLFELKNKNIPISQLSGGEQKKIALSIGLSSRAELVLWDEPTNHLDVETIEMFEDELQNCQNTFMIISHDRYLLNHVTNRIVHIERGTINSHQGTYIEYLEYLNEKEKELAKNLDKLENKHRRELAWMRQGIKARRTRSKKRVEAYENIKKDISDLKGRAKKSVSLDLTHSGRKTKVLVEMKEGAFSYDDSPLLEDLNLIISKKEKIALMGPNGAGKSTLLKLISGDLKISSGSLKVPDQFKVITFDQKREKLDENKTLFEVVGDGDDFVTLGNGQRKHIMSYLENFLFQRDQINRPISTLSGGEKNRLQLAMFMRHNADLWIFDEPTNDLDIETIELLEKELSSYESAVIIVGHDRAFLDNTCQKSWLVHNNTIEVFEGGYSQVAPYLHAIELEKKSKNVSHTSTKPKEKKVLQVSNKDKKRYQEIEIEIQELEDKITQLETSMAQIDYTTDSASSQYENLNSELSNHKKLLENLYMEWEELEKLFT